MWNCLEALFCSFRGRFRVARACLELLFEEKPQVLIREGAATREIEARTDWMGLSAQKDALFPLTECPVGMPRGAHTRAELRGRPPLRAFEKGAWWWGAWPGRRVSFSGEDVYHFEAEGVSKPPLLAIKPEARHRSVGLAQKRRQRWRSGTSWCFEDRF